MRPLPARSTRPHAVPALLCCFLVQATPAASADQEPPLFSAEGYRIAEFRAPVPSSIPGITSVDTEEVRSLIDVGEAVAIDVMPAPRKPENRPAGSLWLPPARRNIPGSWWLPNVGFGRLSDELEEYFKHNLERISGGDLETKLIIYCLADCWMSWNAAKRAAGYGYSRVYWYPEGTTGWAAAGLPLEKSTAVSLVP